MKHLLIIVLVSLIMSSLSAKTTIKFATLAPEGSTWMNVMRDFAKEIEEKTGGEVKFKIYGGGVQGDEKDVLRKIRFNQLHSAGFTGVGMGEILPEVRILEAPFLFKTQDEVDHINQKFFDRFATGFEKNGYVLLGWAEVGFVYVYTNTKVTKVDEFEGVKMWMWEGDPLAEATFQSFGISPIPLSVTDVLTSLQTGLIDGVYTAPLACVSLQWFTKVKYMVEPALTNSIGAVLVSKKMFNKMSPKHQNIVREAGQKYFRKLTEQSRLDNVTSTQEILKQGMERIIITDPSTLKEFEEAGKKARQNLVGKLYDQALLTEIEQSIADFRKNQKGK